MRCLFWNYTDDGTVLWEPGMEKSRGFAMIAHDDIVERNARIDYTQLSIECGFLTGTVGFDYGGAGQGMGSVVLYNPEARDAPRLEPQYAGAFIQRVLEVVGCEKWEQLKGCPCRVRASCDKVYAVGHYLKDKWFDLESEFKAMREAAEAGVEV